jgi:lipoprotein-anchoring transpeptidase ErfK/SrfK
VLVGLVLAVLGSGTASGQTETTAAPANDPAATTDAAPTQPAPNYRPTKRETYVARLITRVGLYPKAGGGKLRGTLAPWISDTGNPVELLVLNSKVLETGETWLKVRLPSRPNDATAWIRESNVILRKNPMRVEISLRRHELRVFRRGRVVLRIGVALGAAATPTPRGRFAIYQKIREVWWSPLGPWALHLTAHSNVLFEYAGGPGRVAIHGARGVLWAAAGTNPSHGCIRIPDPGIRKVVPLVSPGTPVDIVA